jgi:hypothetical protein
MSKAKDLAKKASKFAVNNPELIKMSANILINILQRIQNNVHVKRLYKRKQLWHKIQYELGCITEEDLKEKAKTRKDAKKALKKLKRLNRRIERLERKYKEDN